MRPQSEAVAKTSMKNKKKVVSAAVMSRQERTGQIKHCRAGVTQCGAPFWVSNSKGDIQQAEESVAIGQSEVCPARAAERSGEAGPEPSTWSGVR